MENHTRVLQQRVQVSAFVSSREQTNERVTGKEHEKRQADGNQTHNTDDAGHHVLREAARTDGNR